MRGTTVAVLAALAGASPVSATIIGGGVVSLDVWNQQASAELGFNVTVFRMYAAFDAAGNTDIVPRENVVHNFWWTNYGFPGPETMRTRSAMYQAPTSSGDLPRDSVSQSAFAALRWDTWLTIGAPNSDSSTIGLAGSSPFIDAFTIGATLTNAPSVYNAPPDNGLGNALYDDQFGTGLYLVLLGQFTLLEVASGADIVDIRTDRAFGSGGGAFQGLINVGTLGSPGDPVPDDMKAHFMPTSGVGAGAFLAGFLALRRRR